MRFFFICSTCIGLACGSVVTEAERIAERFNDANGAGVPPAPVNTGTVPVGNIVGTGVWARSTSASPVNSQFGAVAVDSSGNVYAGGTQYANGTYTYSGQSAMAAATAAINCIIVKYAADGTGQWTVFNSAGLNGCSINGLTTDSSGNVYAVGVITAMMSYTFGGLSKTGLVSNVNALLLKIDSAGTVQWVRSSSSGAGPSTFNAVTVDSAGNIYAAGFQTGATTNTYDGASVTSPVGGSTNTLLVKYDSNGNGIWGRSASAAAAPSVFSGVTVDASGDVYAAGSQTNTASFTYGAHTVTGLSVSTNAVIVKYSSGGTALWAQTTSGGSAASQFLAVRADSAGGIFAVGNKTGNTSLNYGTFAVTGPYAGGTNAVAVKYDTSGTTIYAQTVATGANATTFNGAAADTNGNVYAAGNQTGSGSYTYGSVSVSGANTGTNASLVKYDSNGNSVWARSVSPAPNASGFTALAILNTDFLFAVGQQTAAGSFTYSTQSVSGAGGGANALILKYR